MALMALVCDSDGNSRGMPITKILSCSCVPETMDQFPSHSLTVSSGFRPQVLSINVLDTIKIIDLSIGNASSGGLVAWGVILDPSQQIDDNGDQIQITLHDITEQARWMDTGLGWVAANTLHVITQRLGSILPGWSATFTDTTGLSLSSSPAQWVLVGGAAAVTPDGNTIQKSGGAASGWDAEMMTTQYAAAGPMSFTFRAVEINTYRIAGLTNAVTTGSYPDVTWGIDLTPAATVPLGTPLPTTAVFAIFEAGADTGYRGTYQSGDYFTVGVQGTQVTYYKNGVAFYNSTKAATFPIYGNAVLYSPNATVDTGMMSVNTTPDQAWWSVRYEKETVLGALNQLAENGFRHLRTGRDNLGQPIRGFELGSFGDISPIRLVSPDGFSSALAKNPNIRVITEINRKTDGSGLTNAVTPLGAGNGDTQVDLEDCWRVLYDAPTVPQPTPPPRNGQITYPVFNNSGFQFWQGFFPPQFTPFPEYDPDYPITRHATFDGRYQYDMTTAKTDIPAGKTMWSSYNDSQFSYVDTTDANRLVTARALYVAAKSKLKTDAFIHEIITLKTVGNGRPPRAGQRVYVDYTRQGSDAKGSYQSFAVQGYYYVMQVKRTYDVNGQVTDDYTLTKSGRWAELNSSAQSVTERQLTAVQMVPRSNIAIMPITYGPREIATGASDGSTDFSCVMAVHLPAQVFNIITASFAVDFMKHRATVVTAGTINEGTNTGSYSTYTGGNPFAAYVSQTNAQSPNTGVVLMANGGTGTTSSMTNLSGTTNGQTGQFINNSGGTGTLTGGIVNGPDPGRPGATSGIYYNTSSAIINQTSGSSKTSVGGPGDPNTSYTSPAGATQTPGATVDANTANAIEDAIHTHTHTIAVNQGGNPDTATNNSNNSGIIYGFGGQYGLQGVGKGGIITMSFPGDWTANSSHQHTASTGSVNVGASHNIDGTHTMAHGHNMDHSNQMAHEHLIDHYHLMPHQHNMDHTHYIDHTHNFAHTHAMVPGIFEANEPYCIQVWIDGGDGNFVDRSPYLYDNKSGKYGPFFGSFECNDIARWVNYPGRVVRIKLVSIASPDSSNPVGLGSIYVHGSWLVELSGVASIIFAS